MEGGGVNSERRVEIEAKTAPFATSRGMAGRWGGSVLVGVFALIVPIGYLGNEGIAPVVALGGLLTLTSLFRQKTPPFGAWALMALAVWAAVSFFRSPVAPDQIARLHSYNGVQALVAPKLIFQYILYAAFLTTALYAPSEWRRRALAVMAVSVALTVLVLSVEGVEGGRIYAHLSALVHRYWTPDLAKRNAARGGYGVAVLLWPAAPYIIRRGGMGWIIALGVAAGVSSILLGVDAPAFALALALAAFALVRYLGRRGVWICLAIVAGYFAFAPIVFLATSSHSVGLPEDVGKMSWHVRLDVWRFTAHQILAHPLVGWGLDASRAWPDDIPMHPHDAALQLWLETGAIGVAFATLFWTWIFVRIDIVAMGDRTVAGLMAATATSYLVIGAISFGVWQEWWLALGVFAIAACALMAAERRDPGEADASALSPIGAAFRPVRLRRFPEDQLQPLGRPG
jgi:O-antigen ligase